MLALSHRIMAPMDCYLNLIFLIVMNNCLIDLVLTYDSRDLFSRVGSMHLYRFLLLLGLLLLFFKAIPSQCLSYPGGLFRLSFHLDSSGTITFRAANIVSGQYVYMCDLMEFDSCRPLLGPVHWPVYPSPVHLQHWERFFMFAPRPTLRGLHTSGARPRFSDRL